MTTGWLNLPNALTAVRLLAAAPVAWAILADRPGTALAMVVAAGVTDAFDGAAARRMGSTTRFGAYFDPIADKVLLSTVFIALLLAGRIPAWFVGLVFGRDLLILLAAGFFLLFTRLRDFPPSRLGKLSTFFQIGCAALVMGRNAWPVAPLEALAELSIWISAAFTLASGIGYAARAAAMGRKAGR